MSDNNNKTSAFGVCIELSRREPYFGASTPPNKKWCYNLFGNFDEMQIEITKNLEDFSSVKRDSDLSNLDEDGRMHFHSETKKLFLLVNDPDGLGNKWNKIERLLSNSPKMPMIALIAVKLRHQFFDEPRPCNPCDCVENVLQEYKKKYAEKKHSEETHSEEGQVEVEEQLVHAEFCTLTALNIYSMYVLIRTNDPNFILYCARQLQNFTCNYGCELVTYDTQDKVIKSLIKSLYKSLKDMQKLKDNDPVSQIEVKGVTLGNHIKKCIVKLEKCIDTFDKYINMIDNSDKSQDEIIQHEFNKNFDNEFTSSSLDYLKAAKSFEQKELVLKYTHAMRVCGPMPLVLQTYTIIGCEKGLTPETVDKETKLLFELQMQTHPGSSIEEKKRKAVMNPFIDPVFSIVLGSYYYVCQGEISPKDLLKLYSLDFLNWTYSGRTPVQYTSGRFLSKIVEDDTLYDYYPTGISGQEIEVMKEKMFTEDAELAETWLIQQHKRASELFKKINSWVEKFPFLKPISSSVSLLHMQGCRRFYYALSWSEFKDARDFFDKFYLELGDLFDQFYKPEQEQELTNYAWMAYESMRIFLEKMASLFHDRTLLDLSMHENTRPGIYATGAYEILLKKYSVWIDELKTLLKCIEEKYSPYGLHFDLNFVLVPVEQEMIHSFMLFPLDMKKTNALAIYEMPIYKMLDVAVALPLYVHETGHYLGFYNREGRAKTYLSMVAFCYANHISRVLCMRAYPQIPEDIVLTDTEELYEKMFDYLSERHSKLENNSVKRYYLDHVEYYCRIWLIEFFDIVLLNISSPPDQKTDQLIKSFVDMCNVLGAESLAQSNSLVEELLLGVAESVLTNCKMLIRECYADLIMIYLLELEIEQYFHVLHNALRIRNNLPDTATTPKEKHTKSIQDKIDAIRAISAFMLIKYMNDNKNKSFDEIMSEIPDTISDIENCLPKDDTGKDLYEDIEALVYGYRESDYFVAWGLALAPYLYESGRKIKDLLDCFQEDTESEKARLLNRIRNQYQTIININDKKGMERLVTFLAEEDNV